MKNLDNPKSSLLPESDIDFQLTKTLREIEYEKRKLDCMISAFHKTEGMKLNLSEFPSSTRERIKIIV